MMAVGANHRLGQPLTLLRNPATVSHLPGHRVRDELSSGLANHSEWELRPPLSPFCVGGQWWLKLLGNESWGDFSKSFLS